MRDVGIKLAFVGVVLMGILAIHSQSTPMAILTSAVLVTIGLLEIRNAVRDE